MGSASDALDIIDLPQSREAQPFQLESLVRGGEVIAYRLLEALIPLLLRSGVSPAHLSLMIRRLLIENAAQVSRLRNGRINRSQIAAATGLSRAEVSRHLSLSEQGSFHQCRLPSTTARVISAWRAEKRYLDKAGTPRALPFSGRTGSFTKLVREYGRDVPPRAMAAEMQRQGLVEIRNKTIVLVAPGPTPMFLRGHNADESLDAIDAIVGTLLDDSQAAPSPITRYVRIAANDEVELNAIRNRVTDLISGTLATLNAIQQYRLTGARGRRRNAKYSVSVAVAVSERRPNKDHQLPRHHMLTMSKK